MTTVVHFPDRALAPYSAITVLRTVSELTDSWDNLASTSGSPTHHFAWISACEATFGDSSCLRIVLVGDRDQPRAIAPLVIRARGGLSRLEMLGLRELQEPTDFIFQNPAHVGPLAESLLRMGVPLHLDRIPATSPTGTELKKIWGRRGLVISHPVPGCPWIALDHRWAQTDPPIAAGRRSDLRRARRKAEKIGPVECEIVSPSAHDLDRLLDEVFRVEAANWKGRERTALVADPVRAAFYRRYARGACGARILRLCFLRIGDQTAATQFAVESDQRFWLLKIGYDEKFAHCSPGTLLMWETIRHAASLGLESYEFLGSPEPWVRLWTDNVRPCSSIRAYPARPRGLMALATDVAEAAWRKTSALWGNKR